MPTEPGPGLRVDLELAGHHLAVESESGDLGAWPLEAVRVRRLEGDTFEMTVAGEDLHFIADDTISFAYSGMPVIERFSGPSPSRSRFRNLLGRLGSGATPSQPVPAAPGPAAEQIQVRIEQPELEIEQPEVAIEQPEAAIEQPVTEIEQPVAEIEQPVAEIEQPVAEIEQPVAETELPGQVSESVVGVEAPRWTTEAAEHPIVVDEPRDAVIDMDALVVEEVEPFDYAQTAVAAPPSPTYATPEQRDEPEPSCPGTTAEGLPCRSPILSSSGYCYSHDPERTVEDGYRKAQEARARLRKKATARLTKVYSRLDKAMHQVERGELEPDVAMAMAQLAQTMCAILDFDEEGPETES